MPKPSENEDKAFYDKNMQDKLRQKAIDYEKLRVNNAFDTNRHIAQIKQLTKNRKDRILDIGAGYGFFVDALFRAGFKNAKGIEISRERREMARLHTQVPILDTDINDERKDIGTFDIITIYHVVEHMANPIEFVKNARKLLAPKGIVVIEVPNSEELLLETCGAYNDFYWIRAHLNYFTKKPLVSCLKKAGFKTVRIEYQQRYGLSNLFNWLSTGTPQIERPVFETDAQYAQVESYYKEYLARIGKSDTLIAIARR
jgi:2-polyprenyl-3-methyl-5-hydroxy-6-metoxy-1,4-benzoquinol methylase